MILNYSRVALRKLSNAAFTAFRNYFSPGFDDATLVLTRTLVARPVQNGLRGHGAYYFGSRSRVYV